MVDYLLWLLGATGLCLLVGWKMQRRRAARRAGEDRLADERAAAQRAAAARSEAAGRAEQERLAAAAEREAQQRGAEQAEARRLAEQQAAAERVEAERMAAERIEATRVEAERVEAARIEAGRIEAERIEAERMAAECIEAERAAADRAAEQAQIERLAALQAEREAQRLAAQAQAQAQAEALRVAEQHAEDRRLAAERVAADVPPRVVKTAAQTLVLVADDSKVVRVKTGRLLAQHQYQVAYASDGLDAVQQMQAQLPDVLITDVEMPGLDGFELTRHVRDNPQTAQLPVIMITAADDRHREQADASGVSVLLGKPYPEDALIAHIRLALGQDAAPAPALTPGTASAHGALDALA